MQARNKLMYELCPTSELGASQIFLSREHLWWLMVLGFLSLKSNKWEDWEMHELFPTSGLSASQNLLSREHLWLLMVMGCLIMKKINKITVTVCLVRVDRLRAHVRHLVRDRTRWVDGNTEMGEERDMVVDEGDTVGLRWREEKRRKWMCCSRHGNSVARIIRVSILLDSWSYKAQRVINRSQLVANNENNNLLNCKNG